jgi:pimeloyl-ACP methyl ester carboxylesterase
MELAVHETRARGSPTILFLHGVGNTGAMWREVMASLTDFHCLAPDLPGHGASRGIGWRSRRDTAERMAAVIEAQATGGRAHVVGLSLGASVAIELLATRPDLLNRVIVDGCSALPSRLAGPMKLGVAAISPFLRFENVARLIGRAFGAASGPGLDEFVAQIRAVDAVSFRHAFADANDVRSTPGLLSAPCPTLFVAGERELAHVRASNRLLAAWMPTAEAHMVPGAGHGWGATQHQELYRAMVRAWLAAQPLPAGLALETGERPSVAEVPA